jgi:anti-anti-sigma factor
MSSVDFRHIKTNMVGDVAVVEVLSGELRFPDHAKELGDELRLVAAQEWASKLLINMKHVKYLSSTGFAVLVNVVKQENARGGTVRYCEFDPEVRIGAGIIGLDKIASLHETEHEALVAFKS